MKALSLRQPWASLVAVGAKTIETRSWSTKYRGPVAIHAAKRPLDHMGDLPDGLAAAINGYADPGVWRLPITDYPLGSIVATCTLVDVVPILDTWTKPIPNDLIYETVDGSGLFRQVVVGDPYREENVKTSDISDQRPYGDFTEGRFAWILADVKRVDPPVPFKGGQGLSRSWEPVHA